MPALYTASPPAVPLSVMNRTMVSSYRPFWCRNQSSRARFSSMQAIMAKKLAWSAVTLPPATAPR